jgi:ATP-dependent RNA helicase RhlE
MNFADLGLSAPLCTAVADKGYDTPSPIQREAIPPILAGRDLMAAAQTGTGKTAAFTLPLLQRLSGRQPRGQPQRARPGAYTDAGARRAGAPERPEDYGAHLPLRSAVVFGGVKINPQIARLRRGCDMLVATPGRLLDLHQQGAVSSSGSSAWCWTRRTACSTWASSTTSAASSACCQNGART